MNANTTTSDTTTPWPADAVGCCRQFLSELTPTMHPRIGCRLVKRAMQRAGARIGLPFYVSERDFAEIAEQAGFNVLPRVGPRIKPAHAFMVGVSRRSLYRFLRRHGVQPC
ncbi:MAG: hypothetical protein KJ000_20360 [Pirellulaceae bacterium]|nr:hypothetical protein [Pirellulaceae bacterium]